MDYAWTVYFRDILVILAASAVILASIYLSLVSWQVYKMTRELSVELEPILSSAQQSASQVESTVGFLAPKMRSPSRAAANSAASVLGLVQMYRRRAGQVPPEAAPLDAAPPPAAPGK